MISKALLKRIYQKTLKKYPSSAKILKPLLHYYRWTKHRMTHGPSFSAAKPKPYSAATYRLYQRSKPYFDKTPHNN